MPTPTIPVLGSSTVVRKWLTQVNTGTSGAPIWTTVGGVTNTKFNPDAPHFEDDSDMQSGGAGSQTKTAGMADIALTVARKVQSDGVSYDVGQEFLRLKGINQYGPNNSVQIRICEYTPGGGPRVEAYTGLFSVGYEPQGGSNTALDTANITLNGQGACSAITHPYPITAAAPTITATAPTTALVAGGTLVHIYGTGFTGTTGVTFGATAATNFSVESDGLIIATAPAKTAGAQNIVVTNATGASAGFPITYA